RHLPLWAGPAATRRPAPSHRRIGAECRGAADAPGRPAPSSATPRAGKARAVRWGSKRWKDSKNTGIFAISTRRHEDTETIHHDKYETTKARRSEPDKGTKHPQSAIYNLQ